MPLSNAPIVTIRELVQELLRHRDSAAYAAILSRYAVPSNDLEPYFRWNTRHDTDGQRLQRFVDWIAGKRLTYRQVSQPLCVC